MALEGCGKFLKYAVFLFNFLIFIGGAAVLGVGIWIIADPGAIEHIGAMLQMNMYKTAGYLLIACGAIVLILGFLGCCGAIKESKCMLGTFFALLFLIFIILLVGGILAVVFKNKAVTILKEEMSKSMLKQYGIDTANNKTNLAATDAWNAFQTLFTCCGMEGGYQSNSSWYAWSASDWYKEQKMAAGSSNHMYVPKSCCTSEALKSNTTIDSCTGKTDAANAAPRHYPNTVKNPNLNEMGCYSAVVKTIEDNIPIVAGVGIGIALLMLMAMIFSICLCRSIEE
ncbi:tetraspanin-18-like isoform X2 [Tubulanus polymorphus]|uniref:tetraspanin-18-like isoform X2 n=1 Tax=Tubulanus polymorphus TaxID=672921 RepID=UPI003DA4F75E